MAKIKICGMMGLEDIAAVNQAKPDMIGFVFAKGRKRTVDQSLAASMKQAVAPEIKTVGVFLNNSIKEILFLLNSGIIDFVQLHGDEDEDFIRRLKEYTDQPVIKAVRVRTKTDILCSVDTAADYLLLDTFRKDAYGGTGESFDWSWIPPIQKPFFLAGGINEENIRQAGQYGAWCLDVSSGAETDGRKDGRKIQHLVNLVRSD